MIMAWNRAYDLLMILFAKISIETWCFTARNYNLFKIGLLFLKFDGHNDPVRKFA